MSTEELLRPRYKVIAQYPFSPHPTGHIIKTAFGNKYFDQYPHLFKKLEWWEQRDSEELPEYVKTPEGKVRRLQVDDGDLMLDRCKLSWFNLSRCTPATLAEYEQYINQKENQ